MILSNTWTHVCCNDGCSVSQTTNCNDETTMTYTPSNTRPARALFCDDVRAGRAPRDREPCEARWSMPGLHVAPFESYV